MQCLSSFKLNLANNWPYDVHFDLIPTNSINENYFEMK